MRTAIALLLCVLVLSACAPRYYPHKRPEYKAKY